MRWLAILLLFGCSQRVVPTKAVKSTRPKKDIVVMVVVLGIVIIWANEEGFNKHTGK